VEGLGVGNVFAEIATETQYTGPNAGKGGNINVTAGVIYIAPDGFVSADTYGPGLGGNINLTSTRGTLFFDSSAGSAAFGSGAAGSLTLDSSGPVVLSDATASVKSAQSDGGDLTISAAGAIEFNLATLTARAARRGGNITLTTPSVVLANSSTITGQAGATGIPNQNGGAITIDPTVVVLRDSVINGLASGRDVLVTISAQDLLVSTDSQILTNDIAFTVDTDVTAGLISLRQANLADNITLIPACSQMTGNEVSSFTIVGNGGLPPSPGGWIGPLLDAGGAASDFTDINRRENSPDR
jgi:hypothetical protein